MRVLAFYDPRYYATPETDRYFGKGYSEWTRVATARPLFAGHYQPHIPADLGFYDLRMPEIRQAQADMASHFGIHGFCYLYYWDNGRRLWERPFDEVHGSGKPEFPFCLAWASDPMTIQSVSSKIDISSGVANTDENLQTHAQWTAGVFRDVRYIRVGGRPLYVVSQPQQRGEWSSFLQKLRTSCCENGEESPFVVGMCPSGPGLHVDNYGCDALISTTPDFSVLPGGYDSGPSWMRVKRNLRCGIVSRWKRIYSYDEMMERIWASRPGKSHLPCMCVGWDDTARSKGQGLVLTGSTPDRVYCWAKRYVRDLEAVPSDRRILFLNAWNAWSEGMHLEPDQHYGYAYLEAIAAISKCLRTTPDL